ncbi:MAG: hypothetical protein DRN27_04780 [Thermoplasmata archaeon]|nr:MAG: hypothetical protein DRN27_04780 [Thermoplasmata archaeon]
MENKTLTKIKILVFYFCLIFFIFPIFSTINVHADENLIIPDVSPTIVESETNFTVSVYDPNIMVGTPYLSDVNILFDDIFYKITPQHENGEIIIKAPKVLVNKTYLIEAFTINKSGNITITVIPSQNHQINELVITPDSYTIDALKKFSVLVTDKNGQAIENATVIIQDSNDLANTAKTNENGRVFLIAPNKDTITINAKKNGYNGTTEILRVRIQKDTLNGILTHPYTPIIGSMIVLISIIIYVTYSNKFTQKKIHIQNFNKIKPKKQKKKKQDQLVPKTLMKKKKIEQIKKNVVADSGIVTSIKNEVIIQGDDSRNKKESFKWFEPTNDLQKDKKQNQKKKEKYLHGTEEIHKKIDKILEKQEKEK